jgi:hypothetical protein
MMPLLARWNWASQKNHCQRDCACSGHSGPRPLGRLAHQRSGLCSRDIAWFDHPAVVQKQLKIYPYVLGCRGRAEPKGVRTVHHCCAGAAVTRIRIRNEGACNIRLTYTPALFSLFAQVKPHVWKCLRPLEYRSRIPQTCVGTISSMTFAVMEWH